MEYQFCINDFEGPLDLLLHLVKTSKMDIYEIDIRIIIEEYLEFIEKEKNRNIDIASSYLVMAAELIHLKSKMLIQVHDELVFNVALDEIDEMKALVQEKMENVIKLDVPLKVDIEVGNNWYEAK